MHTCTSISYAGAVSPLLATIASYSASEADPRVCHNYTPCGTPWQTSSTELRQSSSIIIHALLLCSLLIVDHKRFVTKSDANKQRETKESVQCKYIKMELCNY